MMAFPNHTFSRLSFQRRLAFALGFLSLLVAAIAAIALWGLTDIGGAARRGEQDSENSSLASEVVLQALLSRRYEKDFFLNAGDVAAQDGPLQEWHAASMSLRAAIKAYEAGAVDPRDQQRGAEWRAAWSQYVRDFSQIEIAINGGEISSPQDALQAFEPFQPNIQRLTDEAVQVAQAKTSSAQAASHGLTTRVRSTMWYVLGMTSVVFMGALTWSLLFPKLLIRPILALREGAMQLASGDYSARVSLQRNDELGQLANSFNQMAGTIQQRTAELDRQYAQANEARSAAEEARDKVARQLAVIEEQRVVIRDMSTPILPLTDNMLIMPLVGALDSARIQQLHERALESIEVMRARYLLLDITGVPVVDTEVSLGLIQVVQAAALLGCKVMLVGIRPEVAQSIVGLGIDLRQITTHSSLQSVLEQTLLAKKPA